MLNYGCKQLWIGKDLLKLITNLDIVTEIN